MKLVVTSEGTTPDSLVEAHFGRGSYFLIFDTESGLWEPSTILNAGSVDAEGAGVDAAQTVIATGAEAVIASHCGTKAFKALDEGGVKIYPVSGKTVAEAVEALTNGELQAFTGPDLCSLSAKPDDSAE